MFQIKEFPQSIVSVVMQEVHTYKLEFSTLIHLLSDESLH